MSSHRFDRRDYYATLRHYEERLDQAIALRRQPHGLFQPIIETLGWSTLVGVRVSRVRSALADVGAGARPGALFPGCVEFRHGPPARQHQSRGERVCSRP